MVKSQNASIVINNKAFRYFILSQGVSSFGDTFGLVAVTALLIKLTGSGLYAGFGLLLMPLCSLFFSVFSGCLADLINEKLLLIINDVLRGVVAILFAFCGNIFFIYLLSFILAFLNVFYIPATKKLLVNILEYDELLSGNSVLTGVSGITYIIGPILAGFIIVYFSIDTAFFVNGFSFFYSALQILFINNLKNIKRFYKKVKHPLKNILNYIIKGTELFIISKPVKELTILYMAVGFGSSAINFVFYTFAFNVLKVTNLGWGFMLSVFYGASLIAFIISINFKKLIYNRMLFLIYILFMVICFIWFFYGFINGLGFVILLQSLEGVASALLMIFISTRLQMVTLPQNLGVISGINEILGNLGKIIGIAFAYILMIRYQPQRIFLIISFICTFFILYQTTKKLHLIFYFYFSKKSRSSDPTKRGRKEGL